MVCAIESLLRPGLFVFTWVLCVHGQSPVVTCVTSEFRSSLAAPPQQRESTDDPSKASHTCREMSDKRTVYSTFMFTSHQFLPMVIYLK